MRVLVLNGPNLGRLGSRQPEVYGTTTYAELVAICHGTSEQVGLEADVRQTDDEATMLGWLHAAADDAVPVVLNAGAWTHYSYALRDACAALTAPLVEVHLSQVHVREAFRHTSVVSAVAQATVTGMGVEGYRAALRYVAGRSPAG